MRKFYRWLPVLSLGLLVACGASRTPTAEPSGRAGVGADRTAQVGIGDRELASVADVVEKVLPSVVSVTASKVVRAEDHPYMNDPFFRRFFGPRPNREERQQGLGSGVVFREGYILTNNHVVDGASEIKIASASKREYAVELVGTDPKTDVAVLKVKGTSDGLIPITLGDSQSLRLGDTVLAIGNPFGLGQTVTKGIVSAKGRADLGIVEFEDFIQTDAAINPGNSGGALVNSRGQLVGINTAILSRSGGSVGIGFAIPTNMAKPIAESLIAKGRVVRGYLGVLLQDVDRDLAEAMSLKTTTGVLIADVVAGGPAEKAGIQRGDVIVEVNGQPVTSSGQLRNVVASSAAGATATFVAIRKSERRSFTVRLDERPSDSEMAQQVRGESQPESLHGLTLQTLTPEQRQELKVPASVRGGVVVRAVEGQSAAGQAGLREGDVIVEAGGKPVPNVEELRRALKSGKGKLALLVWRDGGTRFVVISR
ncbi:MAG: Do family serine endopeptidase [Polyangiaceae bacterium]|nr:Do family serine endopeptidase [Polyangiaceae bacterium]